MAEAVAALSLAGSILQVIDFGLKFASTAWSICRSGNAALEGVGNIADLHKINLNLETVLHDLREPVASWDGISQSNQGIVQLAMECSELVERLLSSLSSIGLRVSEKMLKRDTVVAAFKLIWKGGEIKMLQERLNGFRQQLTLYLLVSLRDYAKKSLSQQEGMLMQLSAIQHGNRTLEGKLDRISPSSTDGIGASVLDFLTSHLTYSDPAQQRESLLKDLVNAIHTESGMNGSAESVSVTVSEASRRELQGAFVARLRYDGMEDREGRIAEPYESTFRWIFNDDNPHKTRRPNFKEWLESDQRLYWITGKAGSGKSTLMKFICRSNPESTAHSRSKKCLAKWSRSSTLIIASFYFWNSGIRLQMSQKGLLMTLLHQILKQCPALIPHVSPSRWEALCLFNEDPRDFTEQELHSMLQLAAASLHTIDAKLCLFVDGLDEFEGDHEKLVDLFAKITTSPGVKICVASRPWVIFEDAFKQKPSLMVQDLTHWDIKHYVTSNFHGDDAFALLRQREQVFADQLIQNVVSKASGVFLWVQLVVASLLAGMCYGDRVCDLQRRLDLLPPDLEKLYERILLSLDPFYLEHAAQLFALVKASSEPPSILLLSFADEELEAVLNLPSKPMTINEVSIRVDTMRRRLNSRCKGLLELSKLPQDTVTDSGKLTVQYLHRTVKDYIERVEVQKMLQSGISSLFDPYLKLCSGNLAMLKVTNSQIAKENEVWNIVEACISNARAALPTSVSEVVSLLDDLDKTGLAQYRALAVLSKNEELKELAEAGHWVTSPTPLCLPLRAQPDPNFGCSFLSLMVCCSLVEYVKAKAKPGCLVQKVIRFYTGIIFEAPPHRFKIWRSSSPKVAGRQVRTKTVVWPLLLDAIRPVARNLDMITCLLQCGAGPNFLVEAYGKDKYEYSPWTTILVELLSDCWKLGYCRNPLLLVISHVMVKHGAIIDEEIVRRVFVSWTGGPLSPSSRTKKLFLEALFDFRQGCIVNLDKVRTSLGEDFAVGVKK